ncbi:MAG: hypothetical protein LHW58_00720, partial [Candidatus Cloacimonetes bacterium]|nr:hypothetical protein [Candidatus Cloacimonadota bacterium]MCK9178399.1 hypothetical protein [Candidatus Cloacimonadota bacterium]
EERLEEFLIDSEERKAVVDTIITIPGFSERSAMLLLSEVGLDEHGHNTACGIYFIRLQGAKGKGMIRKIVKM